MQEAFVGFDRERQIAAHGLDDQGTEHDEECQRERHDCGDQRIADRFEPQPIPAPRLDDRIGAVERDPQGFDAVRGEIHRKRRADGQGVGAGGGQHVMDFARDCAGDLRRPRLQEQRRCLVGELLGAEEAGQRGQHDQERKQRHQRRQRDMAGDCPSIVRQEGIKRVEEDEVDVA